MADLKPEIETALHDAAHASGNQVDAANRKLEQAMGFAHKKYPDAQHNEFAIIAGRDSHQHQLLPGYAKEIQVGLGRYTGETKDGHPFIQIGKTKTIKENATHDEIVAALTELTQGNPVLQKQVLADFEKANASREMLREVQASAAAATMTASSQVSGGHAAELTSALTGGAALGGAKVAILG